MWLLGDSLKSSMKALKAIKNSRGQLKAIPSQHVPLHTRSIYWNKSKLAPAVQMRG